ncbi:MAG: GHKL domain-containing protein [Oscillospiraceae bacterium]|nr:GHKL domain-containing protein [Oscillospiraceae bacterium]
MLTTLYTGGAGWLTVQFILFCVGSVMLLFWMYRISFDKALYTFLMFRAVYTAILYIVLNAFRLALPGQYIGFGQTPLFTLAVLMATGAAFPFLWRYFTGRLRAAFSELDGKTIRQLCIPPVLFFILDQFYSMIRDSLGYDSYQTAAIFIFMLLTGLATYYVNLRMVMDSARRARREAELHTQIALQAGRYEQLAENMERTRQARHDLRHHLSVINAYIEKDDRAELETYLREHIGRLPEEDEPPVCQNLAVDAVVRHYLARARAAGAELDARLTLPQNAGVAGADLCVVFGNVFENAALAVERQTKGQKYIKARCQTSEGKIVLTVDNSTNPKEKSGAGVGQESVRAAAERLGGTARFERGEGVYQTSVLLLTE